MVLEVILRRIPIIPNTYYINNEKDILEGNDPINSIGKYSHDLLAQEALDYIKRNRDNKFFLYLTFTTPHYELTVPEDSKEPYKNLGWEQRPMNKGHYRNDPEGNTTYAGMVSRMDGDVGRIMDLLEELQIDENTLVIFASDNGPEYDARRFLMSAGGLRGQKRDLYEGGIRTPMIAWWRGTIEAGSSSDLLSAFWDFLPTACDIANVKPSVESDGISMLPTLLGKRQKREHEYLYWELNQKVGPIQALRYGDYKAVKYLEKPLEIYNLKEDRAEKHNIAEQEPALNLKMMEMINQATTPNEYFPIDRFLDL